jgi:hypothetical protein
MSYEKPVKLSVLLEKDEKAFAVKITNMVQSNYDEYKPYREKCKGNESVWRGRHWDEKPFRDETDESKPRPNVPVLYSTVENCKADIVDNRPGQIIRGVGNDDDMKALIQTELLRFIFQRANYNSKFKKKVAGAIKRGEGAIQVYWNPELMSGMGDVDFRYIHIDNYAWDKSAADVNEGRFFAIIDWVQPEELYEYYPDLDLNEAIPEDESSKEADENNRGVIRNTNENGDIKVITFMWKERKPRIIKVPDPKDPSKEIEETMGHITYINTAVVCGNAVLEEHLEQYEYDRFFANILTVVPLEGEPVGLSVIDMHIDDADTVNLIQQQYLCNLMASAEDRFLVNRTAGIDEKALLNYKKKIIHGNQIHQGAVTPFKPVQFNGQALNFQSAVMMGVKERSGQTDFNIGKTNSGVTSGIGIQSLQLAGAKRTRLTLDDVYDDHKNTAKDVLKIANTNYTTERVVRLSREAQDVIEERIKKAMEALQKAAQPQEGQPAVDMREAAAKTVLPEGVVLNGNELTIDFSIFRLDNIDLDYDIEIIPQKLNTVTSDAINSFLAQMLNSKAIDGDTALELAEFEGKERMMKIIRKKNDINAQMQQLAQQAEQAVQQADEIGKIAEQQAQEIEQQKAKIVDLKIKLGLEKYADNGDGDGEETEQPPLTKEEAYQRIMAEVNGESA